MIVQDADLLVRAVIIVMEMALLAFLYFISRFYENKFGKRTYYNAYLVPVAAFALSVALAVLAADIFFLAMVFVNALTLIVLVVFGLRLYRMMMGVSK